MANNNNISSGVTKQIGTNLSRISYDVRQEIGSKVIGVLKHNNEIREKLLKRNIGLYPQLDLNEGIGYISNFYSLDSSKPLSLGEEGLLGYTHISPSDYQSYISKKYDVEKDFEYYHYSGTPDSNSLRWGGKYDDYTEHIDKVLGIPKNLTVNFLANLFKDSKLESFDKLIGSEKDMLTTASILNDILQYDNIKYAMEKTRIGTVSPNPTAAFMGAVTTNINNFSGTDTNLGLITNYLYAASLNNGAHFNSLRKTKYITPEAYASIGNKLETLSTIGADFRIDDETGRIVADFGINQGTTSYERKSLDAYTDEVGEIDTQRNIADSKHARYKNIVLNWIEPLANTGKSYHYSPFNHYDYQRDKEYIKTFAVGPQTTINYPNKIYSIWNEGTKSSIKQNFSTHNGYGTYKDIQYENVGDDLLYKTQELFAKQKIGTLIGRFHTESLNGENEKGGLLQTAVSAFGLSHGRNLLTKNALKTKQADEVINGYDNPYCRTWTYHHQYDNIGNLIRPFGIESIDDNGNIKTSKITVSELQKTWTKSRTAHGVEHLQNNTVLGSNGFVNIAPFFQYSSHDDIYKSGITKCMFSIENLAWLDVPDNEKNLSKEQRGPHGGRIMWFPPYDLKFNENVSVNWGQTEFIGRGEKIYTYTNTERSGTLSFVLLVDHPSILDSWKKTNLSGNDVEDEETLLRFFAGCEILTLDNKKKPIDTTNTITIPFKAGNIIPYTGGDDKKTIKFKIYFPQNYSAFYDFKDGIEYLSEVYEVTNNKGKNYKTDKDTILPIQIQKQNTEKECNELNSQTTADVLSFNEVVKNKKTLLKHKNIEKVDIEGFENKIHEEFSITQTDKKKNDRDSLCERRAIFAKKFVQKELNVDEEKINITLTQAQEVERQDSFNIYSVNVKKNRCATVTIYYTDETQLLRDELTYWLKESKGLSDSNIVVLKHEQLEDYRKEKEKEDKNLFKEVKREAKQNAKQVKSEARAERKHQRQCLKKHPKVDDCEDLQENVDEKLETTTPLSPSTEAMREIATKQALANSRTRVIDGSTTYQPEATEYERWDKEAQYFQLLKDNDSFLYGRLVDKIKYFTPAFHSITPEGFNARLAFLHQCTRQGNTYSVSDTGNKLKSGGNLAFGRPPICILRIGDFYHTKIVIDSITMDYENPQWDMNPEGIGMQPMFARISLNFKFLGGSDIEAPIARLQNALSFNYYANQSVYDDRADRGAYTNKVPTIKGVPWKPTTITNETPKEAEV